MSTVLQFQPKKKGGFVYISEARENRFFFVIYAPSDTRNAYVIGRHHTDDAAECSAECSAEILNAVFKSGRIKVADAQVTIETHTTSDILDETLEETLAPGGVGWRPNEPAGHGWTLACRVKGSPRTVWVRFRVWLGARS